MLPPARPRVLAWVAVVMIYVITAILAWDAWAFPDVIYLQMH